MHKVGAEVWLLDPYKEHMDAIAKEGVTLLDGKKFEIVAIDGAVTIASLIGVCDMVVVLTKSAFTRSAIEESKSLFDESTQVVSLQNGIGNTGALVNKGRELGIATPVNEAIARLARVIQSNYKFQFD